MTTVNPTPDTAATVDAAEGTPRRELPRGLVWVLLILAVAANAGSSLFSLPIAVGVVFGVVALSLGALLVRDHYRRSPRSARRDGTAQWRTAVASISTSTSGSNRQSTPIRDAAGSGVGSGGEIGTDRTGPLPGTTRPRP